MNTGDYDNNNKFPFTSQLNIMQMYYIKFVMPSTAPFTYH